MAFLMQANRQQLLWQLTWKLCKHAKIAPASTQQKIHCFLTDAAHLPALRLTQEHFIPL